MQNAISIVVEEIEGLKSKYHTVHLNHRPDWRRNSEAVNMTKRSRVLLKEAQVKFAPRYKISEPISNDAMINTSKNKIIIYNNKVSSVRGILAFAVLQTGTDESSCQQSTSSIIYKEAFKELL